ncbi:uncharacterized protein SCHCODRAFT_02703923 [Schizophyllum commune H4-8]|nr:uncharacterized protein SCHCODRAFT_02703923 [Schizophyllum commune H4-8]KAI5889568.1 hypothetical protein SCHCODRAFT_02703923 [Schizophyllum commune H4-8]
MPTTQLPFEELTRLCICANLSSLDDSINLSFRPSPQDARVPQSSFPSGYQLNLETMTTATGTTLVISLSQVNQGLENQANVAASAQRPRNQNSDVLDPGTTSAFEFASAATPHEHSMRQGLPLPDPYAWADYDGLDGIYSATDGMHAHNLLDMTAMDRLLFCNDIPEFTSALQGPYTPSTSTQGDLAQQPPSPPSSSPSPSPPSSSSSSACDPPNSPSRKRKNASVVKGRSFPCTMGCGEEFSRQHDRFRHEVLKHERSCRWVCDTCHRFFGSQKNLERHVCNTKSRWVAPAKAVQ